MENEKGEIGGLVNLCIDAAANSRESVERWRRQRRTLERLPSQLADELLRRLVRRHLLYPSLLEIFQHCVEVVDLKGESFVDVEWMVYLGGFRFLRSLNVQDCKNVNSSALWHLSGLNTLKELNLSRCSKVTDAGVKHLLSLSNLEKLHLAETKLSDDSLMLLASLRHLHMLDMGGLPVTDKALYSLKVLTQLEHLDLWGSEISNEGADMLQSFPKLTFLNLAWTRVTKLPTLPALASLNMSSCTIDSIFKEDAIVKAPLSKLVALGASFVDVDEALSNVESSYLTYLDLSGSGISNFKTLSHMKGLQHLNLSLCGIRDPLVKSIASVGANLQELILSHTGFTSAGICSLVGKVGNLRCLVLSHTPIDDASLSYIALIPLLKMIDLSYTSIKGVAFEGEDENVVLTLTELHNLRYLETINLEGTDVRDYALEPLSQLKILLCLYLKSDFLSDTSLHALSSLQSLNLLSFQGAVLTNSGLALYRPPPSLNVLDLRGCWLLTEDFLLSFCKSYPQINVWHEKLTMLGTDLTTSFSSASFREVNHVPTTRQKVAKQILAPNRHLGNSFCR